MDKATLQRCAKHFVEAGADIIDVGMVAGESNPSEARRLVQDVKEVVDVPVSIDSLDPAEIQEAVKAGVDLVLSADAGNIESIAASISKVAVVVIPTNQNQGLFPKKAEDRVEFLEQIITQAKNLGVVKCVADLILDPSDVLESFVAFRQFARRNPNVPIFVGVSNVTELMDVDSVGINALLARLSSEVGASIMLATEKSDKAKGTVWEEAVASKMMFLAKKRCSVPKDLGVDLLLLKDKRNREELYDGGFEKNGQVVAAEKPDLAELDRKGSFTIMVDRVAKNIVAMHYSGVVKTPDKIIKGKTADAVYVKIINLHLISREDHAAYLGSELAKAEIALCTGKEYVQDKEMFAK
jgi:dihydropteroate synthase-like protein